MANDNNNINELVAEDDDPTSELELPTFAQYDDGQLEADAQTFDAERGDLVDMPNGITVTELRSDLKSRKKTISRLQYDIEQLRSKWLGLEAEINAREKQTDQLNIELQSSAESIDRKNRLLRKRDGKIKSLKSEIRTRADENSALNERLNEMQIAIARAEPAANDASGKTSYHSDGLSATDLRRKFDRSEDYADTLRQQSQDLIESNAQRVREVESLTASIEDLGRRNTEVATELTNATKHTAELQSRLDTVHEEHEQEIHLLRFELGTAQESVVNTEELNNQLASDLVATRSFKDELEHELESAGEQSARRADKMQREIGKLTRVTESYEQKLSTKSEAISVLLSELAKKSEQIESISEIEEVIHDIDERMTERTVKSDLTEQRPSERVTRVLVGTVDGQVLRFPLFKDRLTIGRTQDNDIQLKAAYVSRRHAVVETVGEATRIIDSGSKNGIHVNSSRISDHDLAHGDMILIGNARFRYEERKKRDS